MTTKALFIKEWRECWKIGAWAAGIMLVGSLILLRVNCMNLAIWDFDGYSPSGWRMLEAGVNPKNVAGSLAGFKALLLSMASMGIALAIRQFMIPFYTAEWGFILHRPVSRRRILSVKLAVAALLGLPLILIWLACWLAAQVPGWYPTPTPGRILVHGLILLSWGAVAYCAVADSVLLRNFKPWRWIKGAASATTLILFIMCITAVVIDTVVIQWSLLALLLAAIYGTFLTQEM
jgi:hypothetical protein